eukprot:TRINITY_DN20709_c1_g1_i1.p1 TRINITY_DN20709_c1_g1~~TRINITY_DN20709_c1_g1_i1.p1  ORF type:complete len:316 (-),score=79.63 TRINITY_DN20709_c1_g1_i1:92-1039(-)
MTKQHAKAPDDKKSQHKDKAAAAEQPAAAKAVEASAEREPAQRLNELKSRRRPGGVVMLPLFLLGCTWLVIFSTPCKVKKSRVDCGWKGISASMCRAAGGLLVDSDAAKEVVQLRRKSGENYGIEVDMHPKNDWGIVTQIYDGAVKRHNEALPADDEQRLRIGDRITKIDGSTGKSIEHALKKTKSEKVDIRILRPVNGSIAARIPSSVWSLLGASSAGRVLIASGFNRWLKSFLLVGGPATFCWLLSGYSAASLPLYYWGASAFVAWWTTGACFDDETKSGPHCYCSANDPFFTVVSKAWARTTQKEVLKLGGY